MKINGDGLKYHNTYNQIKNVIENLNNWYNSINYNILKIKLYYYFNKNKLIKFIIWLLYIKFIKI